MKTTNNFFIFAHTNMRLLIVVLWREDNNHVLAYFVHQHCQADGGCADTMIIKIFYVRCSFFGVFRLIFFLKVFLWTSLLFSEQCSPIIVHPSIIILYQGLHEDNNHQFAHRWRHHVLSALPHFLGGDFPTAPLVNGSDQLAGPLSLRW